MEPSLSCSLWIPAECQVSCQQSVLAGRSHCQTCFPPCAEWSLYLSLRAPTLTSTSQGERHIFAWGWSRLPSSPPYYLSPREGGGCSTTTNYVARAPLERKRMTHTLRV